MAGAHLEEITQRVELGERLSNEELENLAALDVLALGLLADTARRRYGTSVGYRRVLQLNAWEAGALPDAMDADEVRLVLLPDSIAAVADAVREIRTRVPATCVISGGSFSAVLHWADSPRELPTRLLGELRAAGLDDLAEWPIDDDDALRPMIAAGQQANLLVRRLTVGESAGGERVQQLLRARGAIERTTADIHLAPLLSHPRNDVPTTGYDDLRSLALARLSVSHLAGSGRHVGIEVDWSRYGPKLAQVALLFGADHLDAVPATDEVERGPRRQTVAEIERHIRAAGFEPRRATSEHR